MHIIGRKPHYCHPQWVFFLLWHAKAKSLEFLHVETASRYLGSQLGSKVMLTPASFTVSLWRTPIVEESMPMSWKLLWSIDFQNLYWLGKRLESCIKSLFIQHLRVCFTTLCKMKVGTAALAITTALTSIQILLMTLLLRLKTGASLQEDFDWLMKTWELVAILWRIIV